MGPERRADGAAVSDVRPEKGRYLLVRQGPLAPEERAVLDAVCRQSLAEGHEVVTVLLGTSSYEAESPTTEPSARGEQWILGDDARGRGIRPTARAGGRIVDPDQLVAAIMTAERVIQFP